ncbi:glycosyltransferase [Desulfotomaculum sp. 1211_IL3151]|uniref:glycosyltransferase n=1 Tax=Desulfotomaculum sp. 1211_IL3151 TaxID=3084055 RepID=UPI002FD9F213
MWTVIGSMIILVLACYGVYYLVQDLLRFFRAEPGPPVSMLVVIRDRAQDLEYLIRRMNNWRKKQWVELELVVVDDGSTDDTNKILSNLQKKYSYRLVSLPQGPRGDKPDEALQTGLLHCHNALVWLVDLRMLPQGLLAEKVFRVFFCQGWR